MSAALTNVEYRYMSQTVHYDNKEMLWLNVRKGDPGIYELRQKGRMPVSSMGRKKKHRRKKDLWATQNP